MITHEDMKMIQEQMELVFVTRKNCDEQTDVYTKRLNEGNTHFAVLDQRLKVTNWLLTAVCGAIVAAVVKLFIGG